MKTDNITELNMNDLDKVAGGTEQNTSVTLSYLIAWLKNDIGIETLSSWVRINKTYARDKCMDAVIPYILRDYSGYTEDRIRREIPSIMLKAINAVL